MHWDADRHVASLLTMTEEAWQMQQSIDHHRHCEPVYTGVAIRTPQRSLMWYAVAAENTDRRVASLLTMTGEDSQMQQSTDCRRPWAAYPQ